MKNIHSQAFPHDQEVVQGPPPPGLAFSNISSLGLADVCFSFEMLYRVLFWSAALLRRLPSLLFP